jgi:hypothetical protein
LRRRLSKESELDPIRTVALCDKPIKLPGFNERLPTALNQDGRQPFSLEPELERETARSDWQGPLVRAAPFCAAFACLRSAPDDREAGRRAP